MPDHPERSEAGDPIHRYEDPAGDASLSAGDEDLIESISDHIERHLGPVESVFHEVVSPIVHVDLHWVAPSRTHPWHTLVTSGMSERPMNAPEGVSGCEYAELLVSLPATWPLTSEALEDESNYWPLRWLKLLARFPHEYQTWLWNGHTMPNGDPPEPFAPSTRLCSMMLAPPIHYPPEFFTLDAGPGRTVHFWSLMPIYIEEQELKLRKGADALLERLDQAGVTEVIDLNRPNVAPRRRWWRLGR